MSNEEPSSDERVFSAEELSFLKKVFDTKERLAEMEKTESPEAVLNQALEFVFEQIGIQVKKAPLTENDDLHVLAFNPETEEFTIVLTTLEEVITFATPKARVEKLLNYLGWSLDTAPHDQKVS